MAFDIFGFQLTRKTDKKEQLKSFVEPTNDDGAMVVAAGLGQSSQLDLEGAARTEAELVSRYRGMIQQPEVQQAVDDIVNEAISISYNDKPVECVTDDIPFSESIKKKIRDEFDIILRLLDFSNAGYEIFTRWYVDGRLNYHAIIDENKPKEGIAELRYIDPRKLRKIREYETPKSSEGAAIGFIKRIKEEYYIYSENILSTSVSYSPSMSGLKISTDAIVHANSGLLNEKNTAVLSHLHKAYKSLNQLRMMEDASVIYRISRAPERRIFYIDVGNLPKVKAEQYLREVMANYKNKVTYDQASGELHDSRKFMTITDDFYLPRRGEGRGTEITTLPGGQNLGVMEDILYFQKKLYKALNVPESRMSTDGVFNIGRGSEITRDEIKFAKFITRLRSKFSNLFDKILEKQLVLKNIITAEDWNLIKNNLRYDYVIDNHFEELKSVDIMRERLSLLNDVNAYKGEYFSKLYIMKTILRMSEDEIKEMNEEMDQEVIDNPPEIDSEDGSSGGQSGSTQPKIINSKNINSNKGTQE